jgi:4-hydroxy-tetrahydrodipicolinate synthase
MKGIWTVIPSIFTEINTIDLEAITKLIDIQVAKNVAGIVLLGTTSEVSTLSDEEKNLIVSHVSKKYKDKINIMVGVGGNNTKDVDKSIQNVKALCDYIMLTVPYYNKPNQEGLCEHFTFLANNHKDAKFIIYNIPGRSAVNLEVSTLLDILKETKNIFGIKEASGNIAQIYETIQKTNLDVMCGDDSLIIPVMAMGGKGLISVVSNIVPEKMNIIYKNCRENNFKLALEEYNQIDKICKTCFITSNPIPLKMMLKKMNLITNDFVRLPLKVPTKDQKVIDEIKNILLNI